MASRLAMGAFHVPSRLAAFLSIMSTRRITFVVGGVLALASALLASVLLDGKPAVSVAIVGYTTNQWTDETAAVLGRRTYVCAVVAVTNVSTQPFTYLAFSSRFADYTILHQTAYGWKEPDSGFGCGTGLESCPLPPSQGFTFEAVVPTDKVCKVAFDYWDGRTPNPIWDKLPYWVAQRLPWATPWRTVTTEAIDLRGAR
jgi:hypothetical protein